jgi:hypothetical protein
LAPPYGILFVRCLVELRAEGVIVGNIGVEKFVGASKPGENPFQKD